MGRGQPPGPGPHQALCVPPMPRPLQHLQTPRSHPQWPASSLGIPQFQPGAPALSLPSTLHPNLASTNAADNSCCRKAITVQMGCISVCVCVCVCVCMHAHTCMHRGGGLAGKEACLCLAHCLREFMPFPTNLWSPALPANLHWALIDRVWLSGQGAEMPNWRVLGSLSSPFSSMGCSWTQRVAEPPPTQLLRPPGPWGDRINLGVQDGCWEDFSGI